MKNKLTLKEIYDFQERCFNEYDMAVGLNECKKALQNYNFIGEQIEYLRRLGQPLVAFANENSEKELKEAFRQTIENRKKYKM